MCPHVLLQVTCLFETLGALGTFIWALSGVCPHVYFQCVLMLESPFAGWTFYIGLGVSVLGVTIPFVPVQAEGPAERFPAILTAQVHLAGGPVTLPRAPSVARRSQ